MDKLREAEEAQERIYILREEAARKALLTPKANQEQAMEPDGKRPHEAESNVRRETSKGTDGAG